MQLHNLKKNKDHKKAKRVGRGGKRGKTSGKGTKGQNARAGRKKRPEMRDIIKRIPKLRGRGKNFLKSISPKTVTVSLDVIERNFSAGDNVTRSALVEKKLIVAKKGKLPAVKILGGKISKKVNFEGLQISEGAKKSIIEVGGKIT